MTGESVVIRRSRRLTESMVARLRGAGIVVETDRALASNTAAGARRLGEDDPIRGSVTSGVGTEAGAAPR